MKNIYKIASFLSILTVLIFLLSLVFEPKNNLKEYGMRDVEANGILAEKANSIDVLIVGDSEAYSSFIPLEIYKDYGITSYVTATSGQYLYESINYITKTIETQKPKVIILETNALYRNFNKIDPVLNRIYNKASLFQYHDLWKRFNFKNLKLKKEYTYLNDLKGYRYNKDIKASTKLNYMAFTPDILEVSTRNKDHLNKIKELARSIDAKLILVSTPSTVNWNYEKHNGVARVARELDLTYLDLNLSNLEIDWRNDTRDQGDHLNYSGATKVTSFIGKYLADLEIFSDKRNDLNYSMWDKSYDNFKRIMSV